MVRIEFIGNVGKNAELKEINGKNYCTFSVAVSDGKDKEGNAMTFWYDVLKLDENGKLTPYVVSGSKVFVAGKPRANAYVNKAGQAIGQINVFANEFEFVGSKKESEQEDLPM